MRARWLVLALAAGCSSSPAAPDLGAPDAGAAWMVALDPARAVPISTGLLGQYDLSGALFGYDQVPGLASAMKQAGLSEWRVGLERWELETRLLPTLTDGTACSFGPLPAEAFAPAGATDLDLMSSRDWFTYTDGTPVTMAMTADDTRYQLDYVRSTVDVALAFGATPFLNIDSMPRALAIHQTPVRVLPPNCNPATQLCDPCDVSWSDQVENVRPADPQVFAAAVVGLVRRLVEGSNGEPGRPVTWIDFWNEPEFPYAWDKTFETKGGLDDYFATATDTLLALDAYRRSSANPTAQKLRIGLGSFGLASTAVSVLGALDQAAGAGTEVPIDFISFHAYDNDPLAIVNAVRDVAAARAATRHYQNIELALTEWGPEIDGQGWSPSTMDAPLLAATVIALGAGAGLSHAHHTIFWDLYPQVPFGLLDHDLKPKPLFYAYTLLAQVIVAGASRLPPAGHEDGSFDGDEGAVLATRDPLGRVRVLVVNREAVARDVAVTISGAATTPAAITLFDDPTAPPRSIAPAPIVTLPPESLALLAF